MPIVHTVLVKVKPGVDTANLVSIARSTLSSISSVKSYRVGEAYNDVNEYKGYNLTVIMEFEDEAAREAYEADEKHKEVDEKFIIPNADDILINDIKY